MISYSDLKAYSSNYVNITEFRCHMHMKENVEQCAKIWCAYVSKYVRCWNLKNKGEKLF